MSSIASASFRFSTKARNLAQLDGQLRNATVLPQHVFSVGAWRARKEGCAADLLGCFGEKALIVRSSAPDEDSLTSSMAGAFKSVQVAPPGDAASISAAVDEVIDSYSAHGTEELDYYEVLVQPMVREVEMSGVVFTRDLEKSGPYYVLNYDDETNRTDTVTSGTQTTHRVVRILKATESSRLDPKLRMIVDAARELEVATDCDALDIEFAIDRLRRLYVLQVRPLARTKIFSHRTLDKRILAETRSAKAFVVAKAARKPALFGETTIFGEMPDWNPAEMIGTQPKPLAISLYRHLILRSVWREARHVIGYRNPTPHHLLVEIAGRPYVDVRCSFNSFLPGTLPDDLCEKLVNFYLGELRAHPEFHDKVEFEIVTSCLTFDFDKDRRRLLDAHFSDDEVQVVRQALFELTDNLITDRSGVLTRLQRDVQTLTGRRQKSLSAVADNSSLPMVVEQLIEDCVQFGTLPFSVFARCAFVATSFLRSLVHRGALSQDEYDEYLLSITTVAGDLVRDLECLKSGDLEASAFLARYGHLRPGTYDICTPTYAEEPALYLPDSGDLCAAARTLSTKTGVKSQSRKTHFPPRARPAIAELLSSYGFSFDVTTLNRFVVRAIQLREEVKFEFTKNLSAAFNLLVSFGKYHGLTRENLAFVPVTRWLELGNRNVSDDWIASTRKLIDLNRERYELTCAINLPDLVVSPEDIDVVSLQERQPNFVTQKRILASSCTLDSDSGCDRKVDLKGRIVLVENADPGYDWLFSKEIGGLVTKYGGAASHMTIRCAEFGLPAAIGCGEQIFSELLTARSILLDCAEKRVKPNAA